MFEVNGIWYNASAIKLAKGVNNEKYYYQHYYSTRWTRIYFIDDTEYLVRMPVEDVAKLINGILVR